MHKNCINFGNKKKLAYFLLSFPTTTAPGSGDILKNQ